MYMQYLPVLDLAELDLLLSVQQEKENKLISLRKEKLPASIIDATWN